MGSSAIPGDPERVIWHPSPNFGERREGALPDMVVIHYTAMESAESARDWLCNSAAEVSAHYVIGRTGTCWHLVEEEMRAWHAGAGSWGAVSDVNSRSIGIELANTGFQPFSEPQMASLELLLEEILRRWAIRPERVIGHSDMAPSRKIDPGTRFDWQRLARKNLGVWPQGGDRDFELDLTETFRQKTTEFGYPEVDNEILLMAFRSRFRPGKTGDLNATDVAMIGDLARRFPVDQQIFNA